MLADITPPVGPVLLVNHFPSWKLNLEAERETQAVIATRAIEHDAPHLHAHVILAGDLDRPRNDLWASDQFGITADLDLVTTPAEG